MRKFIKFVFVHKKLNEYQAHATRWQTFKYHSLNGLRRVIMIALFASTIAAGGLVWREVSPVTVYAEKEVIVQATSTTPVLERIAKCESGNSHFKDGQVIVKSNTNGTVDIGRYQINSVWAKQATKLGLDLTKEKDNEEMAKWIYANRGTSDWSASLQCWSR